MKYLLVSLLSLSVGCAANSQVQPRSSTPPGSQTTPDLDSGVVVANERVLPSVLPRVLGVDWENCRLRGTVLTGCSCQGHVAFDRAVVTPICCTGYSRPVACMGICTNGEVPWYSRCLY